MECCLGKVQNGCGTVGKRRTKGEKTWATPLNKEAEKTKRSDLPKKWSRGQPDARRNAWQQEAEQQGQKLGDEMTRAEKRGEERRGEERKNMRGEDKRGDAW